VDVIWWLLPSRADGSPNSVKHSGRRKDILIQVNYLLILYFRSRYLNFENRHSSLGKSYSQLSIFFEEHLNLSLLRSCNFNGCYWIPADTLKSFFIKCPKLQELHVAETELTLRDIGVDILPICSKVYNLSFSLKTAADTLSFYAVAETKPQLLRNLKKVLILELVLADTLPFDETLRVLW